MTFYTFMMRNHRGKNTPEGAFAEDIFQDRENFPRNGVGKFDGWHRILKGYLERHCASSNHMNVFEKCWESYVRREKSRLRKYR